MSWSYFHEGRRVAYEDVLRILRSGKAIDVAIADIENLMGSSIKHRDASELTDSAGNNVEPKELMGRA